MTPPTVVWFKRDLRTLDHEPLARAAQEGPCLCLYIYEPDVLHADDHDPTHLVFLNRCLEALASELEQLGSSLVVRVGEAVSVLEQLHDEVKFTTLRSHQETGNDITYRRDQRVARWATAAGVTWVESIQDGVVRRLDNRDGWARQWDAFMRQPQFDAPARLVACAPLPSLGLQTHEQLGLSAPDEFVCPASGTEAAREILEDFLMRRGERYQAEMSSPNTAPQSCSRISPHLALGTISRRIVFQRFEERRAEVRAGRKAKTGISADWSRAMASFNKRLHWNGHFIQRLELQPALEFQNMARAADGLREDDHSQERLEAWARGATGYPMVDACMRYLHAHRWINFRMRAMLVSFASYHLWLDWRRFSHFLARQFIDYEPGIHYSQLQMQSGTTGINAVRIYSPTKQGRDHDPEGHFIRRWVPELTGVPTEFIHEPWTMPAEAQSAAGCKVGSDYPQPLVDHKQAVAEAKKRIYAARRGQEARDEAQAVYQRHGSRRKANRRRAPKPSPKETKANAR